jgi:hypothetical protein
MSAPAVLSLVILSGQSDFPIYDADLTGRRENVRQRVAAKERAAGDAVPARALPHLDADPPPPPPQKKK